MGKVWLIVIAAIAISFALSYGWHVFAMNSARAAYAKEESDAKSEIEKLAAYRDTLAANTPPQPASLVP